jgi:hypothetical protein
LVATSTSTLVPVEACTEIWAGALFASLISDCPWVQTSKESGLSAINANPVKVDQRDVCTLREGRRADPAATGLAAEWDNVSDRGINK